MCIDISWDSSVHGTCPSTVSWKHLPTFPFWRMWVVAWPWPFPLACGCLLLCSLEYSCPFPGWERCWTEWAPSVVAGLCPGWTRATWWIWTSASGGCWMWTLTKDGWRDAGEEEIQSLHSIVDSLQCQNLNRLRGSTLCQGIKSVYTYCSAWDLS